MQGYIHSFESLATLDGAGLRTAVFLAGCPLRCVYCHNPDTWAMGGTEVSAEELTQKICRYKPYFQEEGGVTFTGGEPLLQAAFIKEMHPLLEKNDIRYVLDTSGAVALSDDVRYVLSHAETVILDLKFWDEESYRTYTGFGIENILKTAEYLNTIGKKTWIRTVVVPTINDNEEIISRYLHHVKKWKCVERYELLAFHTMGFYKYEGLEMDNPLEGIPPLSEEVRKGLQDFVDISFKHH